LRFQKAVKQLDEIVYDIIQQHRTSDKDMGDLLSMLLQVQDEDGSQMTDQQLRDEVMNLLLAGHETTANALSWTWMLLSHNPEVQTKLQEELQAVLGGRVPSMADLPQLRYTERVVLESMRLYPPVWAMTRQALQDCEIGGYLIPAGTNVFMSQWVMHRDSRYFDNPEEFQPNRWADDLAKRLPTYAYFPFGGGPRVCIGKSFALMETVLVLATIAQKFQLTLVPEHPIVLQPSITLSPKHGIKMLLSEW
jgi:cytochrome P450